MEMNVPLLDLKAQAETLGDSVIRAMERVWKSQHFILGPEVEALERTIAEYSRCKHAVGVTSGTDAILLGLMALNVGPGDEVISTPFTFVATASCIARTGAKAVFVDIDPNTFNIDVQQVEKAITPRTKAIIPIHLFGQMADMESLRQISAKTGVPIIEDAAQAIGAEWKGLRAGSAGAMGCLSFYPSKNLGGAGDGGMIVTNDTALYERLKKLRVHGWTKRYYSEEISGNFRLDALQAAVLNAKFPHLDAWTSARQKNAATYRRLISEAKLSSITLPTEANNVRHVYNQFVIRAHRRDELRSFLTEQRIGNEIYYPVPMHLLQCFKHWGYSAGQFPLSEKAAAETLALPIYPELSESQQRVVVQALTEFYRRG